MDDIRIGDSQRGLTRREALKRGALVAGTLWAVPVVQAVGMRPAYAKTPSPGCARYCLKWEPGGPSSTEYCNQVPSHAGAWPLWSGSWARLGPDNFSPPGNCTECPTDDHAMNDKPAQVLLDQIKIYGDSDVGFWITYPESWQLAKLNDTSLAVATAKCGRPNDAASCRGLTKTDAGETGDPCTDGYVGFWLPKCSNGHAISHVELILDICP